MMFRRKVYSILIFLTLYAIRYTLYAICYAQEQNTQPQDADQQISDFSLAGYGEKGKKTWEIAGKSADIFGNIIKLQDVVGNMYGEKEDIKLTADKGDFDKVEGKVHVEQNVVVTTSSGARLLTDSLDWDRKKQLVSTKDPVNITRENMVTKAIGAVGEPSLNKITLKEDVQVDINPTTKGQNPIIIICDGPLEIDYVKNIATFKNNVKVDTKDNLMYGDLMDVYFIRSKGDGNKSQGTESASPMLTASSIEKIVARGNVRIIRDQNLSFSEQAVYTALDRKIVLTGSPKLVIYSTEDVGASLGN